ncbi:MAG: penicillin acylase family protein [Citrobacter freundii]|nr:MAG: penicillin acylase family protein [Citrobacter freundii]
MRIIPFTISSVITAGLVVALSLKMGPAPPFGKFLSPQQGFWQNAEAVDKDFSADLKFPELKGKANVYFDERLIPHVFTDNDEDAYFIQGYLHAKFRLWQMEFQTMATAGRISEIIGDRAIGYDREQRRMGLTFAAENMVKGIESNPQTLAAVNAYTAGVNAWIDNLTESDLPVEYKLLDYKPERWSNLKTALFVKQLTKTLAGYGYGNDFQYTSLLSVFTDKEIKMLFPYAQDSLSPIIPRGTLYNQPSATAVKPEKSDSIYLNKKDSIQILQTDKPTPGVGSNNWAVSGSKTKSGAPILCNDPHLDLNFPSIWYELQLHTPSFNAYGVSFPGIPGVVIGFNDDIAFGFTNGGIDIMDFYKIRFKDDSKRQYWHDGQWKDTRIKVEEIKVKGGATVLDTVAYTHFGPVMYDKSFTNVSSGGDAVAIRWKAHDESNELLMWWNLDRAKSYDDYAAAIKTFECPVQNIVFASKKGDIAIWQQGKVPLRWERQGAYLMPGADDSYAWQGYIPQEENPHIVNPARGFVSSANQRAADTTYPYYVPGDFSVYRGIRINQQLDSLQQITPADMMKLQNDNFNTEASIFRPTLMKYIDQSKLNADELKLLSIFSSWNLMNNVDQKGPTIFDMWMDSLMVKVFDDELSRVKDPIFPHESTLVDWMRRDSSFKYADNINTPEVETNTDVVTASFKAVAPALLARDGEGRLNWGNVNTLTIYHLLRTGATPFAKTGISNGGGSEIVNATRKTFGPSWRMVVQLSAQTEAYGVYPGGQSGNPGSRFYDNFVDTWAKGQYFTLWVMNEAQGNDPKVKWKISFSKG